MDYDKVFVMTRVFFFRVFAGRGFGLRTKMCDDEEKTSGTQVSSPASRSTKQSGASPGVLNMIMGRILHRVYTYEKSLLACEAVCLLFHYASNNPTHCSSTDQPC